MCVCNSDNSETGVFASRKRVHFDLENASAFVYFYRIDEISEKWYDLLVKWSCSLMMRNRNC